ncbi:RING finger E3 ubiquitin protein ligase [Marseillevirus marseillevirus]|uniref:RING finger E3 ubiquitin protein ligase n=1 Tax=Marseillevirus marseillevirus TaxID=694581 RepID=D2XAK8_GBMV|nr:RING finger E3 ubiquitin protein ligase [Marseillevirus marseillevirus]YP_009094685.1 conserved putative RING finger E3ubiquitin ligase [Melbournevirus]ADB03985.1 RING finger E3 ubiquitin protein ligase [Marseillevirus marseillevirus]AIT54797.1 RING finger domain-containing protein [Melbournevirus]AVR52921.1 RING finger E3 ubiquitin protein ligase [Marseillevirus Shanghai 1]
MSQCQGTNNNGERCKKKTKNLENLCFIHKPVEEQTFSEECAVCLGKFSKGSGFLLSCGHKFHKSCLKKLESPFCPCCRQEIKKEETPKEIWSKIKKKPETSQEFPWSAIMFAIHEEFGISVYLYENVQE